MWTALRHLPFAHAGCSNFRKTRRCVQRQWENRRNKNAESVVLTFLAVFFFPSEAEAWWWWADAESSASPNSEHLFQYSWHYIIARRAGSARRWGCTQRSPLIGAWHARSLNSDWMRPLGQRSVYFLIRLLNWPWFGRLLIYFYMMLPNVYHYNNKDSNGCNLKI